MATGQHSMSTSYNRVIVSQVTYMSLLERFENGEDLTVNELSQLVESGEVGSWVLEQAEADRQEEVEHQQLLQSVRDAAK